MSHDVGIGGAFGNPQAACGQEYGQKSLKDSTWVRNSQFDFSLRTHFLPGAGR